MMAVSSSLMERRSIKPRMRTPSTSLSTSSSISSMKVSCGFSRFQRLIMFENAVCLNFLMSPFGSSSDRTFSSQPLSAHNWPANVFTESWVRSEGSSKYKCSRTSCVKVPSSVAHDGGSLMLSNLLILNFCGQSWYRRIDDGDR